MYVKSFLDTKMLKYWNFAWVRVRKSRNLSESVWICLNWSKRVNLGFHLRQGGGIRRYLSRGSPRKHRQYLLKSLNRLSHWDGAFFPSVRRTTLGTWLYLLLSYWPYIRADSNIRRIPFSTCWGCSTPFIHLLHCLVTLTSKHSD